MIPARGHANVNFTFTPFPTEEVVRDMDCEGFALGYMSLDKVNHCLQYSIIHKSVSLFVESSSEFSMLFYFFLLHNYFFFMIGTLQGGCVEGKVDRTQGYSVEPLKLEMTAHIKPAL
jgi:hypothetical protein